MATLQDRFNINSQLEHLQSKYVGTGVAFKTYSFFVTFNFGNIQIFSDKQASGLSPFKYSTFCDTNAGCVCVHLSGSKPCIHNVRS